MSDSGAAPPKEMMSEVESFSSDKLKHVDKAEKDSPALAHAKMSKEIEKGAALKPTETQVKVAMPTAEGLKSEKFISGNFSYDFHLFVTDIQAEKEGK